MLDVRIPDRDGLEVLELLRARQCRLPAIVITGHADVPMAVRAMKLGALNFLEKPLQPRELLDEIRKAVALAALRNRAEALPGLPELNFSASERRIIAGLMRGLTDSEMAAELDVSRRTLQHRKKGLFDKCGVRSRRELLERLLDSKKTLSEQNPG